ncbi:MAG: hypothetical protein HZC55_17835 [Verrucomicrobia bacterium]|nr:hypothetical protein [Verrucomicrobiota bacterium]
MFRPLLFPVLAVVAAGLLPAQPPPLDPSLASVLNFEVEHTGPMPREWSGGPPSTIFVDHEIRHRGKSSARLERNPASEGKFSSLTKMLPIEFSGRQVELRGFLRLEDVKGHTGLWLRIDGDGGSLRFDNMQRRGLNGTSDWKEYSIVLPLDPAGRRVYFGFLLSGTGKVWADDLQVLVDGKPVWEAPRATPASTAGNRDTEFDAGSGIALTGLLPVQVENLATLGEVWGFLKYHHPKVTAGGLNWDYELFRILPSILAATDRAAANQRLVRWIDQLGELAPRKPRAPDASRLHLAPPPAWPGRDDAITRPLAERLRAVHAARSSEPKQHYLTLTPSVGNPSFDHESAYPQIKGPDAGYQLLALYRFWNIIRYWFPYRNLIEEDWNAVLREFIPRLGLAQSTDAYLLELMALIARVHDTHANLWSSLRVRPPVGDYHLPAVFRFVEGKPVVSEVVAGSGETTGAFRRGDIVLAIDGRPMEELIRAWTPYYAASNEPTRLRDLARGMGRGPAGAARVRVQRDGGTLELEVARVPASAIPNTVGRTHDLPGPAFRLLSPDIAYLKLSAVKAAEATKYVEQAANTQGWIIDLRNYPAEFVVFALGQHLVDRPTDFVKFTTGDPASPGAFSFTKTLSLQPKAPHYRGRIVILIDEVTQSSAEYTTMAFRAAPRVTVMGSTTAAADGNVSRIPLPGGAHSMISGIGVFYPDQRPTQRVGIVPDREVKPTLAGIRDGRDEVLEAALRHLLGPKATAEDIRKLSTVGKSGGSGE